MGCCWSQNPPVDFYFERFELLKTPEQGMALKVFIEGLSINPKLVDIVRDITYTSKAIDVKTDISSKTNFLNFLLIDNNPFARTCLNTFNLFDQVQFFEFFTGVYNY
mmetsp:Transcript_26413/g.34362  ORF Transcript_26413/g.34362 Transcript_26413/m.34362 type:complete len:107 (+) Transcript_26413:151-471(+)